MNNATRALLLSGILAVAPLAVPASSPITIGALLPLTGPGSITGNLERDGIQFAVDQANAKGGIDGHVVQLLVLDHQAKPAQAVMDYRQLVDLDHTPAILSSIPARRWRSPRWQRARKCC